MQGLRSPRMANDSDSSRLGGETRNQDYFLSYGIKKNLSSVPYWRKSMSIILKGMSTANKQRARVSTLISQRSPMTSVTTSDGCARGSDIFSHVLFGQGSK